MTNEIAKRMSEMTFYPTIIEDEETTTLVPISLENIGELGAAVLPFVDAIKGFVGDGEVAKNLYEVILPNGADHLAELKNGLGNIGAAFDADNHLVGQAILKPAGEAAAVAIDPAMAAMAIALIGINTKLNNIQEIQEEVLDLIKVEKRAEIRANLTVLKDIMEDYEYNWGNELYLQNNHMKVVDIKQNAEKHMNYRQELIQKRLDKKDFLHSGADVKKLIKRMKEDFGEYQLAQYLYAYSSFLDVMFLENFKTSFIETVQKRITDNAYQYRELYTKAYDQIQDMAYSSIESQAMKGVSKVSTGVGKLAEKAPILNKAPIDEGLQNVGGKIRDWRKESVDKTMYKIISHQDANTKPFLDSLEMVKNLYNEPLRLVFDDRHLYIPDSVVNG